MKLFGGLLVLAAGIAGASAEITASDLPQCAIECYCEAGEKVKIPITAYKEQCLSAPFQLAIRECGIKACSKEDFEFTEYQAEEYCKTHGVDLVQILASYKAENEGGNSSGSLVAGNTLEEEGPEGEIDGEDGGPDGAPIPEDDTTSTFTSPSATSTCTECTGTPSTTNGTPKVVSSTASSTAKATTATAASGTMGRKMRGNGYCAALAIFVVACFFL